MKKETDTFGTAAQFVLLFLAFSLLAYVALGFLAQPLAFLAASSSQLLANAFGLQTTLEMKENPHLLSQGLGTDQGFDAEINELCWGRMELAVLFGIILASTDRSLRQRLKGFAFGAFLALLVFNPLRISLSLRFLNEFLHDFLFRVTLAVAIAGFYAWWYVLLSRKNKHFR